MFARVRFDQWDTANTAIGHARFFSSLGALPPGIVRRGLQAATFLETWTRWPLATLRIGDGMDETLDLIDPSGERWGLTPKVRTGIKRNILYNQLPDFISLAGALRRPRVRRKALKVRGLDLLNRELATGQGALLVGFRIGPYPALPWTLATVAPDREVAFIVGTKHLVKLGEDLGETFLGKLAPRVTFLAAQDAGNLARAIRIVKRGGIAATLLELSPVPFEKKTPVEFLDWTIDVPYGLSYLSALTGRPIIPATLSHRRSGRFGLEFDEPVPAATREQESLHEQTQRLYGRLQQQALQLPEQWIGWLFLQSHMGIPLRQFPAAAVPTLS